MYEFHIAKQVRQKYRFNETMFATNGHVVFADFTAVRHFVHRVNQTREPEYHIYPGEVNAAGLIDEIFHLVLREYENAVNKDVFEKAATYLSEKLGKKLFNALLEDFIEKFPPAEVYIGGQHAQQYLEGHSGKRSHTAIATEEALMLFLANFNPANKKLKEFFDEEYLAESGLFHRFADALSDFFRKEPSFGPENQDVFTLLKTPLLAAKDLFAQLEYILENWKNILPEKILVRILKGKDLMKEDLQLGFGIGEAPTVVPHYKTGNSDFSIGKSGYQFAREAVKDYEEYENFTPDTHWMPRVVLLAKNTYVWLDQLTKKYQREIRRLDQVPDEELDMLAGWNFNGLWLIGIWERSVASKRIKHIMGNTDAVSSAYSLYDYEIAADLGGEQAYQNLNERAKARGIRLASDMVPNHTGLYSKWVIENPDYFIQTRVSPFPGYRFTGENISQHPDIEIRIDDGYYSRSDAAVVFQRIDRRFNDVRYIYHGNDGTNMPWNDTAQLDMLKQEVREAVIQKIFEVARRFSIIRFDAAMTLAKKHFSRLWYPRPGTGGDIPSRADFAMSEEEFDALFPLEFWREVVDRMNNEMPETLLLAEAFWMMEGYFVRTLGMHRVYNSAFMHMLKNEENEKYRDLITNTLEFEPEILKRYVNFMSNPDEETAIRQFGSDDKYFGVCVLMSTLPGLPMFAHGQIEGYTEKYGMEYQRAYYNEQPNPRLVERHEREIFPLTQKRYIFSEVDHFNIFDFISEHGHVNENVFAFTNRAGNERALVLYNNKYESASGKIHSSAPKLSKKGDGKETVLTSIGDALMIKPGENHYYIFREHISGLEFLRCGSDLHQNGFGWGLQGFEYRIFWDFREVYDENGAYEQLCSELSGNGVRSIEEKLSDMQLQEVHAAFERLLCEENIGFIVENFSQPGSDHKKAEKMDLVLGHFSTFHSSITKHTAAVKSHEQAIASFSSALEAAFAALEFAETDHALPEAFFLATSFKSLNEMLVVGSKNLYRENMITLAAFMAMKAVFSTPADSNGMEAFHLLKLDKPLQNVLKRTGRGDHDIRLDSILIGSLLKFSIHDDPNVSKSGNGKELFRSRLLAMLSDEKVKAFIGVNEYEGVWYYSKENFGELLDWVFTMSVFSFFCKENQGNVLPRETISKLIKEAETICRMKEVSEQTGYRFEKLTEQLKS